MLGVESRRSKEAEDYRNENVANDVWKTLKDKTNNEKIREMTGMERLEEFLREQMLRCLGHAKRMDE